MMAMTKSRQVYVAILIIAVLSLVIDRAFLQPQETAAGTGGAWQQYAVTPSTQEADDPVAPRSEGPTPRQVEIARRLEEIARQRGLDPTGVVDAFRPSPMWLQVGESPAVPAGPERAEVLAERFRKAHTLTAVMGSGDGGWAIVDGRTLFIGHVLDGFTLVSVGSRSAVLTSGDTRVVLTLPE